MTHTKTIRTERIGKIEINVYQHENSKYNYSVKADKDTPKGKYSKTKNIFYYGYQELESAMLKADRYMDQVIIREANIQKEKQDRKKANASVKASDFYQLGDIVYNSWGWEQTNIEFYQVVRIMNKTIEVREISQSTVEDSTYSHGMADERVPQKDVFRSEKSYKLRVYAKGRLSNPESYYYFNKWDGRPKYCSWYY